MASKGKPYKIVVFGSGGVGKSSLILRFVHDTFSSEYLPTVSKTCNTTHSTILFFMNRHF